jgi:heme A synthase
VAGSALVFVGLAAGSSRGRAAGLRQLAALAALLLALQIALGALTV